MAFVTFFFCIFYVLFSKFEFPKLIYPSPGKVVWKVELIKMGLLWRTMYYSLQTKLFVQSSPIPTLFIFQAIDNIRKGKKINNKTKQKFRFYLSKRWVKKCIKNIRELENISFLFTHVTCSASSKEIAIPLFKHWPV